jgi:spore germination protein KB
MQLESGRMTSSQYMFSVVCFIQSAALLSAFFTPITQQDSWFVVLLAMVAAIPVLLVFTGIMSSFPGKNLIQICSEVFGRVGGAIISLMFIWFFLTLSSLHTRDLGMLIRQTILVETPTVLTTSIYIILCAYVLFKGVKTVMRYALSFAIMSYLLTITSILLTLNIMDFKNFMPVFSLPVIKYVQGANTVLSIPFGDLIAFLMIAPNVSQGKRGKRFYLFSGFVLGSIAIIAVVARDTAVLGNVGTLFSSPSFETLRMANVSNMLNRMEVLFIIVLAIMLFFKIAILYYVTVLAVAQLFGLKSYHPLILMLGALIIAYSVFVYPNENIHAASGREIVPIFWLLFEFLLPLLVLIVGRARGVHKKQMAGP